MTSNNRRNILINLPLGCLFNIVFRLALTESSKPPALRWRHNDHSGVSNHQPHGCLLNRLFRCKSKKTSKLRVTGLCVGNSPGTGEFPAQMASYAENVSIWWRHHGLLCGGIHWWPMDSPHKRAVLRKAFRCHDVVLSLDNSFSSADEPTFSQLESASLDNGLESWPDCVISKTIWNQHQCRVDFKNMQMVRTFLCFVVYIKQVCPYLSRLSQHQWPYGCPCGQTITALTIGRRRKIHETNRMYKQ